MTEAQEQHQAAMCAAHAYGNFMLREMKHGLLLTPEEFGERVTKAYLAARSAFVIESQRVAG